MRLLGSSDAVGPGEVEARVLQVHQRQLPWLGVQAQGDGGEQADARDDVAAAVNDLEVPGAQQWPGREHQADHLRDLQGQGEMEIRARGRRGRRAGRACRCRAGGGARGRSRQGRTRAGGGGKAFRWGGRRAGWWRWRWRWGWG